MRVGMKVKSNLKKVNKSKKQSALQNCFESLEIRQMLAASISGTVTGIPAGQTVYLDINGIGTYVASDPSLVTAAGGTYSFGGLNAGNYLVRIKPLANQFITQPVYGGKQYVQLAANQVATGQDFVVQSLPIMTTSTDNFYLGDVASNFHFASPLLDFEEEALPEAV